MILLLKMLEEVILDEFRINIIISFRVLVLCPPVVSHFFIYKKNSSVGMSLLALHLTRFQTPSKNLVKIKK